MAKNLMEILKSATEHLEQQKVESPRLICELLASRLLNCKRLELYTMHETVLDEKRLSAMRRGIQRAGAGEPVQYIIGQTEFMGHTFKTDKRALIPRPETEILVTEALNCSDIWSRERSLIADIGTGTGCIPISIAIERPDAVYLAIDISNDAIELAKENASAAGVGDKIGFTTEEISDTVDPESVDMITANLPYIPTSEYEELPGNVLNHEPRTALDGGPDGLRIIDTTIQDAAIALKEGGVILLEIAMDQGQRVSKMLTDSGFTNIKVIKDLNDRDRVVSATL